MLVFLFSVDEDLQVLNQDPGGRTLVLVPDPDQDPSYFSYPCVLFHIYVFAICT